MYACQDGKKKTTALSRPSSVTYLAPNAMEQWQMNVIAVTKDTFLSAASVSLVTRPVRNVPDQVLINVTPAGKANGHLHQAHVSVAI